MSETEKFRPMREEHGRLSNQHDSRPSDRPRYHRSRSQRRPEHGDGDACSWRHAASRSFWLTMDMIAPVAGVATTLVFNLRSELPWVLAFFAGSFLYIGASDLLPEAREHDSPWVGVATSLRMLAIYLTTRILRGL